MKFLTPLLLLPAQSYVYVVLICFGFYLRRWRVALWYALIIMMFDSVLCRVLKMHWAHPLNPQLGILDYALPSGHTFAAPGFYTALAYVTRQPLFLIAIPVLSGGLVLSGYHNCEEVISACFISWALFPWQCILLRRCSHRYNYLWLLSLPLFVLLYYVPNHSIPPHRIAPHWFNVGILLAVTYPQVDFTLPHDDFLTAFLAILGGLSLPAAQYMYTLYAHPCWYFTAGLSFSLWVLHGAPLVAKHLRLYAYPASLSGMCR